MSYPLDLHELVELLCRGPQIIKKNLRRNPKAMLPRRHPLDSKLSSGRRIGLEAWPAEYVVGGANGRAI